MPSPSKKERILELFMNEPTKHWHFSDIVKTSKVSVNITGKWLRQFRKQQLIKRIKKPGKMSYFRFDTQSPTGDIPKKLFGAEMLAKSGLLAHLSSLQKAKVVVLFGSFSRSDWHKNSDIDIFIYGNDEEFLQGTFEIALKREIQVHLAKNKNDLLKMHKLLPYILEGTFMKGSIQDLDVTVHVKTKDCKGSA